MMPSDPQKMSPDTLLATAASSLECFGLAIMPGFEVAPHHHLIIEKVERLLRGKIRRLGIIVPPRHGKSTIASILLPAYYLGRNPGHNVIVASYGAELSEGWGRRVRNILSSPLFNTIFPGSRLSQDSTAMHRFSMNAGGEAIFTGRAGPLTGRGANLLVLDDLLKDAEEARSDIVCRSVTDWLQHVAFTRLARDARVIAISTRWSERDPMGWLLRQQQGWEVLHLPAISEGGDDPLERPIGTPLWESQFPLPALQSIRSAVGASVWQCLYQGNPTAAQGTIFKREWFRHYQEIPQSFTKIVQSWDTAFKAGATNDYSVCTTFGQTQNGFYLLHLWRDKVEFPELKKQVALQAEQWSPHTVLVEDKASGQSLVQELQDATTFPVLAVKVDSDKVTRASAITAFFESGKVFFPEGAAWRADLEDELAGFPGAVHDDCVDSVAQALNHLREKRSVFGLLELYKSGRLQKMVSGFITGRNQTHEGQVQTSAASGPSLCAHPKDLIQALPGNTEQRCGACGFQWPVGETPAPAPIHRDAEPGACECGSTLFSVIAGGQRRCQQCGKQTWPSGSARLVNAGVTRADVLSGRWPGRMRRF